MRLQTRESFAHRNLTKWMFAATFASILGLASVAEATNVRNPIERRLHPGRGFFVNDGAAHVRTQHRTGFWNHQWFGSNRGWQRSAQPAQKSWRWQRSSRAELHHPGPRGRR